MLAGICFQMDPMKDHIGILEDGVYKGRILKFDVWSEKFHTKLILSLILALRLLILYFLPLQTNSWYEILCPISLLQLLL